MVNLADLVREAVETQAEGYITLIEESTKLLASEKGILGNFRIEGRLNTATSSGEIIIVGDLHGDFESLIHILSTSKFIEKATKNNELALIFLGDYGDRGSYSPEVYYTVLKLKQSFPENVVLMRGNHEGPDDLLAYPHDLPQNLQERFAEEGKDVYTKLRELHENLYNVTIMERLYVLIHGGVPQDAASIKDLTWAHLKHPKETILEEMLWNDPVDGIKEFCSSPRGAGKLFGEEATRNFLEMLDVRVLIRGHEPAEGGLKINHQGKVLTLFSRKGHPYFNSTAAYLHFDPSIKLKDAHDLMAHIHKF